MAMLRGVPGETGRSSRFGVRERSIQDHVSESESTLEELVGGEGGSHVGGEGGRYGR